MKRRENVKKGQLIIQYQYLTGTLVLLVLDLKQKKKSIKNYKCHDTFSVWNKIYLPIWNENWISECSFAILRSLLWNTICSCVMWLRFSWIFSVAGLLGECIQVYYYQLSSYPPKLSICYQSCISTVHKPLSSRSVSILTASNYFILCDVFSWLLFFLTKKSWL
jgi:hypothetical protein